MDSIPAMKIRERITRKLLSHDPNLTEGNVIAFKEEEYKIIRLIAREGIISDNEPAVRYKAIAAMANFPSTQNLNVLADLASFGEDFYVRSHAMLALKLGHMHICQSLFVA